MKKQLSLITYLTFATFTFNVQANLLLNPGFEAGLTDWQAIGNAAIRNTGFSITAYEGANYIFGDSTPNFSLYQDIDLFAEGFSSSVDGLSLAEAGALDLMYGGWQNGHNDSDAGEIFVHFLNSDMSLIDSSSLGSFTTYNNWTEFSGAADLFEGTRFIRYEFIGTRVGTQTNNGGANINNDAYLDGAFLEITAVPVPAAVWLFSSGLIGLIGLARRKH